MQLKEEFRSYDSLRREHDAQIVSIAMESRLRISAEQWSSLLYGDSEHKSHMQSILDRLQPADSFYLSIEDFKALLSSIRKATLELSSSEYGHSSRAVLTELGPSAALLLTLRSTSDSHETPRLLRNFEILAAVDSLQPSKLALCQVLQFCLQATFETLSDLNQFLTFHKSVKNSGHSLVSHKRTPLTH